MGTVYVGSPYMRYPHPSDMIVARVSVDPGGFSTLTSATIMSDGWVLLLALP